MLDENLIAPLEQSLRQTRNAQNRLMGRLREAESDVEMLRLEIQALENSAAQTEKAIDSLLVDTRSGSRMNLGTSIQLHHIKKVIAIDHRDCGAARIAYGEAKVANPQVETETHKAALAEFRKQVGERHPQLGVETGLMAVDGKLEMFS